MTNTELTPPLSVTTHLSLYSRSVIGCWAAVRNASDTWKLNSQEPAPSERRLFQPVSADPWGAREHIYRHGNPKPAVIAYNA